MFGQNDSIIRGTNRTDILQRTQVAKLRPKLYKALLSCHSFPSSKTCFDDNLLNNKTSILLNLAEKKSSDFSHFGLGYCLNVIFINTSL